MRNWRSAVLGMLALLLCGLCVKEGISVGANRVLPGALTRHTSALAVAVSCLAYGHCSGFTSFQAVDKVFYDAGLNYANLMNGSDIYHDAPMINHALRDASNLADPGTAVTSMGPHEKGLAIVYLISLAIFGINLSSLFYGFMFLFAVTVAVFALGFRRDLLAMLSLVAACCAMYLIIPVVQNLSPDVNSVHGSRYLPLLAIVPTMYIVFLFERPHKDLTQKMLAGVQAVLLFIVLFARLSGAWMLIASALWIVGRISASYFYSHDFRRILSAAALPGFLIGTVAIGLIVVPRLALDSDYLSKDQTEYRTFWHHLVVAANFNPRHAEITGLASDAPYDDLVAYRLFEQEVARRGEDISSYLMDDEANWPERTTHRKYDYKWGLYEQVAKTIFIRQLSEHPGYVLSSFFFYEPMAIVTQFFSGSFVPTIRSVAVVAAFSLVAGIVLVGTTLGGSAVLASAALLFFMMSLLPAEASGVMPLRLVEAAFLFYAALAIAEMLTVKMLIELALRAIAKMRRSEAFQLLS